MTGKCNLCLQTKVLQRVCHIIPEFFYRDSNLYHKQHNLMMLDLRALLKNSEKKVVSYNRKTGEYDLYKFCSDCDRKIIGKYESYTRNFFYADSLPKNQELVLRNNKKYIECLNADYTKLKLLFLSILWRSAISDRPIFSEIILDNQISDEIRDMILNGVPKKDIEFPVFFMSTMFDSTISRDFLFQPIRMKVTKENGFMFAFGGMIIIYTTGINGIPDSLLRYRIQENGIFRALKVPSGETWKLIQDWYK